MNLVSPGMRQGRRESARSFTMTGSDQTRGGGAGREEVGHWECFKARAASAADEVENALHAHGQTVDDNVGEKGDGIGLPATIAAADRYAVTSAATQHTRVPEMQIKPDKMFNTKRCA
jgi:hypothetical protein